jgi:microcystin-dependent protein
MATPFVGEIRLVGFNFAPEGWMFCAGQLLPISEFETLFNLIGTTYGGDGVSTFALPDLRGRVPVHQGSSFVMGQRAGTETVSLIGQQVPSHNHSSTLCSSGAGTSGTPSAGAIWSVSKLGSLYNNLAPSVVMGGNALATAGGGQPHENRQPSLAINYIISLFGIFPSQN